MTKEERDKVVREIDSMIIKLNERDETFILQIRIMISRYIEKSRR